MDNERIIAPINKDTLTKIILKVEKRNNTVSLFIKIFCRFVYFNNTKDKSNNKIAYPQKSIIKIYTEYWKKKDFLKKVYPINDHNLNLTTQRSHVFVT